MRRNVCASVLLGVLAVAGIVPAAHAHPGSTAGRFAGSSAGLWTCRWAPTMDQDWHNDALCSNGVKQVRPYLRPHDSYITRDELMASARAWARARNHHH
ncbi:hypothetical protein L2K70_00385 [Nocardioides KLBMP 9356]|uniref:Uncharacterized protein n=1 Tax=Nocardioides potassii TaxID=2911371 RepID=A0ABS9H7H9_9ACTN|nr:hypothetical protein [Nocardioides potassii]MCF6376056.1 hypothetical protein [Nocardioides potassii]